MKNILSSIWSAIYIAFCSAGAVGFVAFWLFVFAMVYGWFANIYKLIVLVLPMTHIDLTGVLILRVIGIFVSPLGGIMGLFV